MQYHKKFLHKVWFSTLRNKFPYKLLHRAWLLLLRLLLLLPPGPSRHNSRGRRNRRKARAVEVNLKPPLTTLRASQLGLGGGGGDLSAE